MSEAEDPSKNEQETKPGMFEPGGPGGPGRKAGSRNKATLMLDAIADGEAETILQKQIEMAKTGDQRAAEVILSRVWPARKSRPVTLKLPAMQSAADLVAAVGAVADAVGAGDITPEEGSAVASILEAKRRAIETVELEGRVANLEKDRSR